MCDLCESYNSSPKHIRVEIKRRVKKYLKDLLGSQFDSCIIKIEKNGESHHTYGVDTAHVPEFKDWARELLKEYKMI